MKHRPQCIPCFLRRILQTSNLVTSDEWLHRKILGELMGGLAHVDDEATPAEVMHDLFRKTAKTLGNPDPFLETKAHWATELLANEETIRARVRDAEDPFQQALHLSLLGNEIDDELRLGVTLKQILDRLDASAFEPDNLDELIEAIRGAKSLLFVHDTVGELLFDRLLIEEVLRLAPEGAQMTSVLRTQTILGDATIADATELGLDRVARLVEPGLDCLGLPLTECSTEFREIFAASDLVLAKSQAVYQTLDADSNASELEGRDVWCMFRVKCPVMAEELAVEIGSLFLEPM